MGAPRCIQPVPEYEGRRAYLQAMKIAESMAGVGVRLTAHLGKEALQN